MVAAVISVLLGNQWGLDVLLSGFVQGAGAELIFAFLMYRNYGPIVAALAEPEPAWARLCTTCRSTTPATTSNTGPAYSSWT